MSKHHAQHTSNAHASNASTASTASNEQTPAERTDYAAAYAASRERAAYAKTALGAFEASLDFPLDDFQRQACAAVEADRSVLVAAPTGAGKTIVGEFGIYLALRRGMKAFYTTPIKALSNQKYHDFVRAYGEDYVGLLTGDTSINTEAPVVVMTTEVLRNMLYANSTTLTGLGYVVMDEVHYLADRFRGAVWEEAIIHLPEHVNVISLSATVSNVEEFGAWLDTVRGGTDIIVSEHRPVPLWQHMMVGHRVVDLFVPEDNSAQGKNQEPEEKLSRKQAKKAQKAKQRGASVEAGANPLLAGLRLNPQLKALRPGFRSAPGRGRYGGKRERFRHRREGWLNETFSSGERGRSDRRDRFSNDRFSNDRDFDARGEQKPLRPQRITRPEMVRALDKQGLLPAICFIFSRAGCDGAVSHCVSADITLTTPEQQQTIRAYIAEATAHLDTRDLNTLGYYEWRDGLIRGIAAHHAGLLPLFKEVVETLFTQGLIKLVFATETLALGINMPARTVILEKLTKYNGESHVDITPGEYTQLTGRAGRRGIDIEGHAVVMWRPGMSPEHVATLASTRTYPLNSSFRPTYNMAANLIASYGAERTRKILESSFAQFQADKSVVGVASRVRKNESALEGYREAMACHLGDFTEYVQLSRQIAELEKKASKSNERHARAQAHHTIQQLLWANIREGANYWLLLYPIIGILLAGLFVYYVVRDDISHGVTKILYAISQRKSRIKPHNMWSSLVASSLTIGFGGSVGAEAPIVLTGAAIGSNLGRLFRMEQKTLMLLVGCGAAGAVAGIFKAPIAGLVFVIEVLMLDLTMTSVLPLLISSVTAATMSYVFSGTEAMFQFSQTEEFVMERIPYVLLLGIFCGLVSLYFTRAMLRVEGIYASLSHRWQRFILGAAMLSILIFLFPPLYGEGYDTIETLLNGDFIHLMDQSPFLGMENGYWGIVIFLGLILLTKVFASAATNGGGGCGGVFAPSLYIGCIAGFFFSHVLNFFGLP
ncbi:chloride channel protein, partial [uncultured Rothia sp.]|uniref:chloride channel protein n=1 Tax=uncultured Rothia sp. TaxID=316088 RepID=UPI0026209446